MSENGSSSFSQKINNISLSNDTRRNQISKMSADVKDTFVDEIKTLTMFAIQLDESTDVLSCSELTLSIKYIHDEDVQDAFLFCQVLDT